MSTIGHGPADNGPTQQVYYVQRKKPVFIVTIVLMALNIVSWLAQMVVPGYTDAMGLTHHLGRLEPWRLVTSGFIHFGILHIGLNMLALYLLGRPLEMIFGPVRYLVLYLVSLLGGSALTVLLQDDQVEPWMQPFYGGASGAIFGLFGALVVLQAFKMIHAGNLIPILGLNLALSFLLPGIGWQAHVGGLIIGAGVAWAYARRLKRETTDTTMWVEVGLIAALVVGVIIATYTVL